jgi:hypothetical protein
MSGPFFVKRSAQRSILASTSASSVNTARLATPRQSPWKNDRSAASAAIAHTYYPEYDDSHQSALHTSQSFLAPLSTEQRKFLDSAVGTLSSTLWSIV